MQDTTRFSKVEDVILIDENLTPEYKEIQSWLKSYFSSTKLTVKNRTFLNTQELNCISFDDISRSNKDRLKSQICPIGSFQDSDRAWVKVNRGNDNSHLIIQEIKDNSFNFYSIVPSSYMQDEDESKLCDEGTFDLKYSDYEIVYCIINKLARNSLFKDIEEFEKEYKFYKALFNGNEKDFLNCLLYPDRLVGYTPYPHDYNKIEHYADLKNCLLEIKNSLANKPETDQPTNIKEFDNSTLTQIINDDLEDEFLKHEKRLKADGYIDSENKWINGRGKNQTKTLKDLANLIILLKEKKYLKPQLDKKKLKESDYKIFFEARYGCNLKEQFNEAVKVRAKSLETAKTTFSYF